MNFPPVSPLPRRPWCLSGAVAHSLPIPTCPGHGPGYGQALVSELRTLNLLVPPSLHCFIQALSMALLWDLPESVSALMSLQELSRPARVDHACLL